MATCHDFDPGLGVNSARSSSTSQSTLTCSLRAFDRAAFSVSDEMLVRAARPPGARRHHAPRPRFGAAHPEIDHFRRRTLSWHFDRNFVMILELLRLEVARLG